MSQSDTEDVDIGEEIRYRLEAIEAFDVRGILSAFAVEDADGSVELDTMFSLPLSATNEHLIDLLACSLRAVANQTNVPPKRVAAMALKRMREFDSYNEAVEWE
jgi:hypothetical protein